MPEKILMMKKITTIEITILIIAGLLPLLWLPKEGYIISNGDNFPLFLNPQHVLSTGTYLWSHDFLGYSTPAPAYLFYQYPAIFLNYVGISIGTIQIFYQVILFIIGALSMYYFSKTIYPELRIAPFVAGFFYMFNFFALTTRQNIGFVWIYAFLPLLLALFAKTVKLTYEKNNKSANKNIIYFSLLSVVAFSFAAINPANVALGLFGVAILALFYLVKYRKQLLPLFKSLGKLIGISVPINLWWIIPILSYYFLSNQVFNSTVSVDAWAWTQWRSSFLNLFWLNGFWGWLPEYVPYINRYGPLNLNDPSSYLNSILIIFSFAPFIIAAVALLFKSQKTRFNAYIMGAILVLLFLASGLHYDILRELNSRIYQLPLMSMFREPVSKFTLLIIPFLCLLIGFGAEKIASLKLPKLSFRYSKILIISVLMLAFLVTVQPLLITTDTNSKFVYNYPIESKTELLPYSSYVKIPDYWYQATDWISSQPGDGKVLLTPVDDYYQMPYNWTDGYYGTDQLIDSLIDKPIVSTNILSGYKINNETYATLRELGYAIRCGRVDEFKHFLDILGVKYILQRNDIDNTVADANAWPDRNNNTLGYRNILQDGTLVSEGSIMSPDLMKNFFADQSSLQLVMTFGYLDIYEYDESKPSFYVSDLSSSQASSVSVESNLTLQNNWNSSNMTLLSGWKAKTQDSSPDSLANITDASITDLGNYKNYVNTTLSGSPHDWGIIESPLMPVQYRSIYTIDTTGYTNGSISNVNAKVVQYGENNNPLQTTSLYRNATFFPPKNSEFTWNWTVNLKFEPLNATKFFKTQIWFDINSNYTSCLWIDNCNIKGIIPFLNTRALDNLFKEKIQNQTAIISVQDINPTKIIATVNATKPFVFVTSYTLDDSWVATVSGEQIKPYPVYLGFSGFQINQTGQFDVIIEYKPQMFFIYSSIISIVSFGMIFAIYLFFIRDRIQNFLRKTCKRESEALR
jgi:hypothetical protein